MELWYSRTWRKRLGLEMQQEVAVVLEWTEESTAPDDSKTPQEGMVLGGMTGTPSWSD